MFNKTIIMGRLAYDPKCNDSKSGKRMCAMTIPVDTGWGENKKTQWYKVLVFGQRAEACEKYLRKGDTILAMGEISADIYDGKNGEKKVAITLMAESVTFGPKTSGTGAQTQGQPIQPISEDNPFYNPGPEVVSDFDGIPF